MNQETKGAIEKSLNARIVAEESISGGCINDARLVTLNSGARYFVKSNPSPLPFLFEREAEALRALQNVGAIRVPKPIATGGGEAGAAPFIVMEYIEKGRPRADFQLEMGRRFAHLHQSSSHDRFGFAHDNYLGSTPQPNTWCGDWVEFWREHRLGHQLRLARQKGLLDETTSELGNRMLDRLPELIGAPDEVPCLLHGDLWSGNYLSDEKGEPVLIDPASYYGRREADLAMTLLFGGFSANFYRGYEEVWPLAKGSETRLEVYKLYHLLNHLNLFGMGYRAQCVEVMRRITQPLD